MAPSCVAVHSFILLHVLRLVVSFHTWCCDFSDGDPRVEATDKGDIAIFPLKVHTFEYAVHAKDAKESPKIYFTIIGACKHQLNIRTDVLISDIHFKDDADFFCSQEKCVYFLMLYREMYSEYLICVCLPQASVNPKAETCHELQWRQK